MNSILVLSLIQVLTGVLTSNPNIPKGIGQVAAQHGNIVGSDLHCHSQQSRRSVARPVNHIGRDCWCSRRLAIRSELADGRVGESSSLNKAITSALAADSAAQQAVDPSKLKRIEPI